MKAILLVGGKGSRLRPLTLNTPKAMVPIVNIPFLEHVFLQLRKHGITDSVLALGILAPAIREYFGDGSKWNINISYVQEYKPLGTAGAVKNAQKHMDDTCLVLNGDIFTDLDLTGLIAFHRELKARATIALTPVDDPTRYGLVETDDENRITRFLEKPSLDQITTNMINAGTYVLEPDVVSRIPEDTFYMFEHNIFPDLLNSGERLYAYPSDAYWIDIGVPEKYTQLNFDLLEGRTRSVLAETGNPVCFGKGTTVDSSVKITGPVLTGSDCTIEKGATLSGPLVLGDNCVIGQNTVVSHCVLWDRVTIENNSNIHNTIIANDSHLEPEVTVNNGVIGDRVTVESGYHAENGAELWPEDAERL